MREGGGCRSRSREEGGGGGGGRLECTEAGVAAHRSLGEVSDHKGRAHIGEAEQRGAQVCQDDGFDDDDEEEDDDDSRNTFLFIRFQASKHI